MHKKREKKFRKLGVMREREKVKQRERKKEEQIDDAVVLGLFHYRMKKKGHTDV